jgi:hypothetical protein
MDIAEEAQKAWARPTRGDDRIEVTIEGSRVWVSCKGDVVRVIIKHGDGGSEVETDLVSLVEVRTWRQGKLLRDLPPRDAGAD